MKNKGLNITFLIPILLGIGAFSMIVGWKILDPTYLGWLEIDNDPLMGYLGWSFYRFSPWSFPIGLNPNYGLDVASSIVYSDSVTIMALLFKPFTKLLPFTFQYLGLWTLICFILQGWFAWLLVGLFNNGILFRALATSILLFIPIMLDRIGMHAGLVAQFTILASLYLSFRVESKYQTLYWAILLSTSSLIHFYLSFFVIAIWTANSLDSLFFKKNTTLLRTLKHALICLLILGLAMWQAGYFTIPTSSTGEWGYGTWSMNLLSFLNGMGWSYLLPPIPGVVSHGNRFQYPGLGVFILIIAALFQAHKIRIQIKKVFKENLFLVVALVFSFMFAITNYVNIGSISFHFEIPKFLLTFCNSLRASDRMFWPILYITILSSLAVISKTYRKKYALLIVGLSAFVQIIDTSAGWIPLHKKINSYSHDLSLTPLKDKFWDIAGKKYDSLILINDGNNTQEENWRVFSRYALFHKMESSAAVFARVDHAKVSKMVSEFRNGKFRKNALYVLSDYELPRYITKLDPNKDLLANIDGFNVIAPDWKICVECKIPSSYFNERVLGPSTELGTIIKFPANDRRTTSFLVNGWSSVIEDWGVWAIGPEARLTLPIPQNSTPKALNLTLRAFVNAFNPSQKVEVFVNGTFFGVFTFNKFQNNAMNIPINSKILTSGYIDIVFKFDNSMSPKELGIGDDDRRLSIGILSALFM